MKRDLIRKALALLIAAAVLPGVVGSAAAQDSPTPSSGAAGKKPNILFIMGDDVSWFNVGPYNRGIMFKI